MHQHKNHPIYGIAIPGLAKQWLCRGLIFDPADKVTELKRIECAELTFATKRKAEEYALELCKKWLDDPSAGAGSSGETNSAPLKACALAF
jgi:hypothetical protein